MRCATAPDVSQTPHDQQSLPAPDLHNSRPDAILRDVSIRAFRTEDAAAFRALNEAWITRWFFLEPEDLSVLNDPENRIIARGGHIFVAILRDQVVGCFALLPLPFHTLRLARMAVQEDLRGLGIGRMLLEHAIRKAYELQASRITLETSTKLPNAIHLYQSLGFRSVAPEPDGHAPLQRADVFMELRLNYG